MQPAKRTALRSAQTLRTRTYQQGQRRFAGDHHGPELVSEGQAAHAKNPPNKNESFGAGFFIALAALPVSLAIYKLTAQGTNEQPYFTRLIRDTYADYAVKWARRNDLHTQAMQQAAADRVLFLNEPNQQSRTVDLHFPELVNAASPYNVRAGHGSANVDELIAKYEKEAVEENERKLKQLKDNSVPVERPVVQFRNVNPSAATTPAS
ncbi:Putative NADH-ubiquinone oxidoreductase 17.8kDa subunit [Septoria linicola]|uniref:NADH-ubiquinone oxidoreductase 17.8kDa subunit n=1 Tax=Septoria linicola TaxID=215465 RepID=A0A9Q9EG05_9PEZI|nr:putative NADH-ubiquinone oxidoreductase 17.8kDa subunit [Septoria linicola]USW47808.1 Putative NADH-ubiquinone oxidoreductase 17.8kDa subunit [Septoria linicola]